ncbi:MAG: sensor histidine kinase [Nitrospirota bacterium]
MTQPKRPRAASRGRSSTSDRTRTIAAPTAKTGRVARVKPPNLSAALAIVQRLARTLSGVFDVTSIGKGVVTVLTEELGLHSCSVMLLDADGRRLVNVSGAGAAAGAPGEPRRSFALGEGIAGTVARDARAVRVNDAGRDARFLDQSSAIRSLLCFPLFSGDQVIGVLNLSHPDKGFFTEDHEAVFAVLATAVGHLLAFARVRAELADLNQSLESKVEAKTREIEAAQRRAFQQEKLAALGTLVAGVAHELNNKLVPLVAYSHLMKDALRDEEERRLMTAMAEGADAAKTIVESLLRFARPQPLNLSVVDCNRIVSDVTAVLPQRVTRPDIEVRTEVAPAPQLVFGDAGQLGQVLVNLINNGYDAMSEHGTLEVRTRTSGRSVEVEVADSGHGIPNEHLSKIFDPFFTTKNVGRGTGLGLSLCYGMIRAHRGEIDVQTRPGRTVFTVRLPAVDAAGGFEGSQAREHGA